MTQSFSYPPLRASSSSRNLAEDDESFLAVAILHDSYVTTGARTDGAAVQYGDERGQYRDEYRRDSYVREPLYAPLRFRISENRLFKNGETRYYDHPKFGVVAKVLLFEAVEEEILPDDTEFLLPAITSE